MIRKTLRRLVARHLVDTIDCSPECEERERQVVTALSVCPADLMNEVTYLLLQGPCDPEAPALPASGCANGQRFCQFSVEQVKQKLEQVRTQKGK